MPIIGPNSSTNAMLLNELDRNRRENADSLSKLSSGQVFTAEDPRPAERAIAEGLELKLRGLTTTKQNINDGVSLLQTAEAGFSEASNILIRMKELATSAASSTLNDQERKFLMVEHQALYEELNRIASTTEFNGIPLLNGSDEKAPQKMVLRVGDATNVDGKGENLNEIVMDGLKSIVTTAVGLGIKPVKDLLGGDDGVSLEDATELLEPDDGRFATIYDQALDKIAGYRAQYGAVQNRLDRARDYNDVSFENIAAAKSKISDTDYAHEVSRMTRTNILFQTATALLTQNNIAARIGVNLINSLLS